jgi:hypothetical protein
MIEIAVVKPIIKLINTKSFDSVLLDKIKLISVDINKS